MINEIKEQESIITAKLIIKKSEFIASLCYASKIDIAISFVKKNKHSDARHNCYAYIIGANQETKKKSDDGEPSGSAGTAILNVLSNNHLTNVVCIVTRYFGGIKLGLGPLTRAYQQSVALCIEQCTIIPYSPTIKVCCTISSKSHHLVENKTFVLQDIHYDKSKITFTALVSEKE